MGREPELYGVLVSLNLSALANLIKTDGASSKCPSHDRSRRHTIWSIAFEKYFPTFNKSSKQQEARGLTLVVSGLK